MFLAYNRTTKTVALHATAQAAANGFDATIEIKHDHTTKKSEPIQPDDLPHYGVSHVIYQHVQDVLYRIYGVQDMNSVRITKTEEDVILIDLEPDVEAGATRWSFDAMTGWDLANQNGDDVDASSIVKDAKGATSALRIVTAAGTAERKKRRSALRYGAGTFRWRAYIGGLKNNERASIGSWLWKDDQHELDFEVCHGTPEDRTAAGAKADEVLAFCTSQDNEWGQVIVPIKNNAWHTFEIDLGLTQTDEGWLYEPVWKINGVEVFRMTLAYGQAHLFWIFASVENLTFTGDKPSTSETEGLWNYIEYIPHEAAVEPIV